MKTAFIVSTGTEILLGDTVDTNALYLSRKLAACGIRVVGRAVVGDNEDMLRTAFTTAFEKADIVFSSGGMGPTTDDMTREIACEVLGLPLAIQQDELERIKDYFAKRNRQMPSINDKQALFPTNARVLVNERGTASGFIAEKNDKTLVMLPGPPREMEPMFVSGVELFLQETMKGSDSVAARTLRIMGPGESQVEEIIQEIMKNPEGCGIALLAKEGEVHVRVSSGDDGQQNGQTKVDSIIDSMLNLLGNNVYGEEDQTLSMVLVEELRKQKKTIALAESCTGGLVGKLITDVAGSSDVLWGGAVSYSNQAKNRLIGVKQDTLDQYGAVSPETAEEMADGIRRLSGADFGISITGIAGPDGGTAEKPVGLVYIGLSGMEGTTAKEFRFLGGRDATRILAAKSALDWLRRSLG